MPPRAKTVSLQEIADVFGKTTETIRLWRKEGMPTRMEGGRPRFVIAECVQWREEQIRLEERPSISEQEAEARARKLTAEAALKEAELADRQRRTVPTELFERECDRIFGGFAAVARGQLNRFERDVVAAQTPAEARRLLDAIHDALLRGAQDFADELEAEVESEADDDPEAEAA